MPGVESVGIGVPGLYDPATGTTRFLVNVPGAWAGRPVAGPVGDALGLPASLINDARAFGLAELRLGAGRGAAIDDRPHARDRRRRRDRHRRPGPPGSRRHGRRDRPPDDRPRRAVVRLRQPRLSRGLSPAPTSSRRRAAPPRAEEAVARARNGDAQALDGLAQIGRYLGIGIANMVTLVTPDRVVIGGGVAAAGDLLFEPIRAELRRRVRTTSLDGVTVGAAELGHLGRRDRRGGPRRGAGVGLAGIGRRPRDDDPLHPALAPDRARPARADRDPDDRATRCPSDAQLCAEFGVSRMTARNAMQRLADEGLVMRVPGRGSFVAEPPTHRRADRLLTFSREMERRGRHPSSRLLNREIRPSTGPEASALGIADGEPIVALRRLRLADDEPIAIETAALVRATGTAVMGADLEQGRSTTPWPGRLPPPARDRDDRRGARHLTTTPGSSSSARATPLLVERRVILDTHGRRIEATESRYPADRYALDILFDVEQEPAG